MNWIELVGAFGIGALLIKVLDILWLQRMLQSHEHRTWLRDKRLEAYTSLSKVIMSLGLHGHSRDDPFEQFAIASEAILLTEDDNLIDRIEQFIVKLDRLYRASDGKSIGDNENLYGELTLDARTLVKELRNSLVKRERVHLLSRVKHRFHRRDTK